MRDIARRLAIALYNIDEAYLLSEQNRKLSSAELCILYALDDGIPHSQREISQVWMVPKTTVNTTIKRWEKDGLLTLVPIPGKRRERNILLTDAGRDYARSLMGCLYRAEDRALKETFARYSDTFIEALEFFGSALKTAIQEEEDGKEGDQSNGSAQG